SQMNGEFWFGFWIGLLVTNFICAILGAEVGRRKNAGGFGFFIGGLLGPIGVVIAALVDFRPACPYCSTPLYTDPRPKICPSCKGNLNWVARFEFDNEKTPITDDVYAKREHEQQAMSEENKQEQSRVAEQEAKTLREQAMQNVRNAKLRRLAFRIL